MRIGSVRAGEEFRSDASAEARGLPGIRVAAGAEAFEVSTELRIEAASVFGLSVASAANAMPSVVEACGVGVKVGSGVRVKVGRRVRKAT